MRFVINKALCPGMILAKSINTDLGSAWLTIGSKLTIEYIKGIKKLKIRGAYVDKSFICQEIINIKTDLKKEAIEHIKKLFVYPKTRQNIPSAMSDYTQKMITSIIEKMVSSEDLIISLADLKNSSQYIYTHSVNVCFISLIIGLTLNMSKEELYNLGLAALLHDIGKLFISEDILEKAGKLTELETKLVRTHSEEGKKYLIDNFYNIPMVSAIAIGDHHERYDGSGYPKNKKGNEISLCGRIIAIADNYDALTAERPYKDAYSPSEAVECIMGNSGRMFDVELVKIFISKFAPYPEGSRVKLSNGEIAIVKENYDDATLRPVIKLVRSGNLIDLRNDMFHLNLTIENTA